MAQRGGLDMDQAFAMLRRYARDHNLPLAEVARTLVARTLSAQVLFDHASTR